MSRSTSADVQFRGRLRFIAAALLLVFPVGWASWFAPFKSMYDRSGTILGADFPVFYTLGRLVAEGRSDILYDFNEQQAAMHRLLPGMKPGWFLPALYPPHVAAVMAPVSLLPYPAAYAVYLAASVSIYALTLYVWTRTFRIFHGRWRSTLLLAAAGFPLVWETLIGGQASLVAVAALGLAIPAIRANRFAIAGLLLSVAAYKPNILALVILALMIRWPRILLGLVPGVAAWLFLGLAVAGPKAYVEYVRIPTTEDGKRALASPPIHKFHGLAASTPFTRNDAVRLSCLAAAAVATVAFAIRWRRTPDNEKTFWIGASLAATLQLLGNPYVPIYDLTLLLPLAVFFAEGLAAGVEPSIHSRPVLAHVAVGLLLFGTHLSQAAAQSWGWQPFSWALPPLAWWQWREFSRRRASEVPQSECS